MKKKFYILMALVISFALVRPVRAQMGSMMGGFSEESEDANLTTMLSQMLSKYNTDTLQNLDCAQISDNDLEELGDSVMSQAHPDQEVHEQMDAMMGGEGSESLRQAHINMALNYLGCGTGGYGMMSRSGSRGSFGMGMPGLSRIEGMGYGMPMWGGYNTPLSGLYQVGMAATWLSLIVFLLAGARWFWKKGR